MKVIACFVLLLCASVSASGADRPNILFIYLDDFGWKDTGYMGSDFYETPHLDKLAKDGMIFTDAYACAANCAPSRACLLSGQYTPRHEIYTVGPRARGNAKHRRLEHIPGTLSLRQDIVTWGEALQAAGYKTGMFGKWHLGTNAKKQGFDTVAEYHRLPGFKGHYGPDGKYLADELTDRTIDFIRTNKEGPWCAYLSHFAVHTPLHPKRDLLEKYENKKPGELHNHIIMATMIQAVDDGVGRLVDELDKLGLRENTVILFCSDNGGYGPATDMDPLWGYKGTFYEGGIRVPMFVNWHGVVKAGQSSDEPVIGVDFYPTLLEIASVDPPEQVLDGVSLLPLFKGEVDDLPKRPLFWHFPRYLQSYEVYDEQRDPLFRTRPVSVIRLGDYKLHEYFEDGKLELYNLRKDIREQNNLAQSMPEKTRELHTILKQLRTELDAPVPTKPNPAFDAEAEAAAIAEK